MADEPSFEFRIPGACWTVRFSDAAATVMNGHQQRRWHQKETVGQLFSPDLTASMLYISEATVLTRTKSSRASVTIDPEEAQEQRISKLQDRLYCVGLWHTHPEATPRPSKIDERLAADHAVVAQSVLNGLCFLIVGTAIPPDGWYFGVHDGTCFHEAKPI